MLVASASLQKHVLEMETLPLPGITIPNINIARSRRSETRYRTQVPTQSMW